MRNPRLEQNYEDDERIKEALAEALKDNDPSVREEAQMALQKISISFRDSKVKEALVEALKDKNPFLRAGAAKLLGDIDIYQGNSKAATALVKVMADEDQWVRVMAARSLIIIGANDKTVTYAMAGSFER